MSLRLHSRAGLWPIMEALPLPYALVSSLNAHAKPLLDKNYRKALSYV